MVRELSREPAMFQIGLQGEVLRTFGGGYQESSVGNQPLCWVLFRPTFWAKSSGPFLPFCRAFVVMNFHSESVDFVVNSAVNFRCGFLGAFRPFKQRTEKIHKEIHSKIHDEIPARVTHGV